MRRIVLLMMVAAFMVVMVAMSAGSAMADNFGTHVNNHHNVTTNNQNCSQGSTFPQNFCNFFN